MSICARIRNTLRVPVEGVDLTKLSNIEFYVKQKGLFLQYTPEVLSPDKLLVVIPFDDAMRIRPGGTKIQIAFTDENGEPDRSDPFECQASELLKEAGYDPFNR